MQRGFVCYCHIPPENKEPKWVRTCLNLGTLTSRTRLCNYGRGDLETYQVSFLLLEIHPGGQYLILWVELSPRGHDREWRCWSAAALAGAGWTRGSPVRSTCWVRSRSSTFAATSSCPA